MIRKKLCHRPAQSCSEITWIQGFRRCSEEQSCSLSLRFCHPGMDSHHHHSQNPPRKVPRTKQEPGNHGLFTKEKGVPSARLTASAPEGQEWGNSWPAQATFVLRPPQPHPSSIHGLEVLVWLRKPSPRTSISALKAPATGPSTSIPLTSSPGVLVSMDPPCSRGGGSLAKKHPFSSAKRKDSFWLQMCCLVVCHSP